MSNQTTTTSGFDLCVGDITRDMFHNKYVVVGFDTQIDTGEQLVGRRDYVDGEPVGNVYWVEATSFFEVMQ